MRSATRFGALLLARAAVSTAQDCPDFGIRECTDPKVLELETSDCKDYHLFVARGSDSAYPGHQGDLVKQICDGIDASCNYENVIYPANSSWSGEGLWCPSAATGASNGQKQLGDYAERCPDSKLIVLGYSQGGSVGLDILGGGGGPIYDCEQDDNPALDKDSVPGSNIVAAAIFGSPRRTADQSYSRGKGKGFNGTAIRTEKQLAGLKPYAGILREYCNEGDPICAVGSEPVVINNHLNYFERFQGEVAEWVIKVAKGEDKDEDEESTSTATNSTASSTSTLTSSPSPTSDATTTADTANNAVETGSPSPTGAAPAVGGYSVGALFGAAVVVAYL